MEDPSIPEFYKDKNVFITGGSGFMGKVLVEKLLRSCPEIQKLYVLIRNKKDVEKSERWKKMIELPLFENLRNSNPDVFKKVHLIEGVIDKENLDLNQEDLEILTENVEIVFHCAAAVQFSESIIYSLEQNTKGTYTVAKLSKSMKKLKCFVYVSTAYSNCDKNTTIEERLYPAPQDWKVLLNLLETNPDELAILKDKLLEGHPSTYTLTKAMAEHVMKDFSQYYPVIIVRPSIVTCALEEPIEGWCDTLNGVSTMFMILGLGLVRVMKSVPTSYLDYISVDHAIKGFIIGSWMVGKRNEKQGLQILSCNYGKEFTLSIKDIFAYKKVIMDKMPSLKTVWYPVVINASNPILYTICLYLFQILPSIFFDLILKMTGKPPVLIPITKKYVKAFNGPLASFQMKTFSFPNENFKELTKMIKEEDKNDFFINLSNITSERLLLTNIKGALKYYLKEDISEKTYNARKSHIERLKYLHYTICTLVFTGLIFICTF